MAKVVITIQDVADDPDSIEILADFDPPLNELSENAVPYTHLVAGFAGQFLSRLLSDEDLFDEFMDQDLEQGESDQPAFNVDIPMQD